MISIKLDNNISCEYICATIQKLINDNKNEYDKEIALVLNIVPIIDSQCIPLKLEYNNKTD